jgi:hypothetical protein
MLKLLKRILATPHLSMHSWVRLRPGDQRLVAEERPHVEARAAKPSKPAPPRPVRGFMLPVTGLALCAVAAYLALPYARESYALLDAQDDPVALTDIFLAKALTPSVARIEIENALTADDAELAKSFVELARDRGVAVDPALVKQVEDANSASAQATRAAKSYVRGLRTGAPDDLAGFAGAMTRDLTGYGDIDDAVTEGGHLANGEPADELVFGLACVGLVATAATFVTVGAAVPARAGLSIVKAARRTGRLAGPLAQWTRRAAREAIDMKKLEAALSKVSIRAPAESVVIVRDAVKDAVKLERLEGITTMVRDVGRIQASGGTRAALEGLRLSEGPEEVARVARLAEKEGTKTGAILKLAGRAAFVVTAVILNLIGWMFSIIWAVIGFLVAIKSTTERMTERYLRWRKKRRAARLAAARAEAERTAAEQTPPAASAPAAAAAAAPAEEVAV